MRLFYGFVTLLTSVPFLANVIPRSKAGTVIPLTKRSNSLVDDQGVVKLEVLRSQLQNTMSKLNRGFEAYLKNTGQPHPAQSRMIQARATGTVPLTFDTPSILWQGTISVGSPPKQFTIDFDTGSSDLILPGPNCGSTCSGHQIYDPSSSSTSKDQKKTATLTFGDKSAIDCDVFTDTVTIAGLTATNQSVGAATQYSDTLNDERFSPDGLMGMGFPQISQFQANPFFQTLIAQGVPTAPQFSLKLTASTSGSELFLGGVDTSKFTGNFTNVPVTREGYWEVALDSVNVNGTATVSALNSIIDTGTTLIVAPPSQAEAVYKAIPGSGDASTIIPEAKGFFTLPCDSASQVSMTFGGQPIPLPLIIGTISPGSSQCIGAIAALVVDVPFWVVGDAFLINVYTKFDVGNRQVGFAELA